MSANDSIDRFGVDVTTPTETEARTATVDVNSDVNNDSYSDTDVNDHSYTGADTQSKAAEVKESVTTAAGNVTDTAKDQAASVTADVVDQARGLRDQAQAEMADQASTAQGRLAASVRALSDELGSMADGEQEGMATDLARQGADQAAALASWLEDREPRQLVDEVSSYARRHPGTFLALAGAAGVLAGRLLRGLKDDSGTQGPAAQAGGSVEVTGPVVATSGPAGSGRHQAPGSVSDFGADLDGLGDDVTGVSDQEPVTAEWRS